MYYNELDPYALEWIAQLARCGTLKAGELDGRDIKEVRAADLAGHERCHFFAGIGGWEYALMLAGWKGEVWTGSCPCQPFSQAGKRKGTSDERHLWPVWRDLIAECRPPVVFGEQVASPLGREWLSGVRAEMEALGYEVGAADLCAAGVGAPHIRQRLFWVAQSRREQQGRCDSRPGKSDKPHGGRAPDQPGGPGGSGGPGNPDPARQHQYEESNRRPRGSPLEASRRPDAVRSGVGSGGLANTNRRGCGKERQSRELSQIRGGGADEWVQVKSTSTCFWHPYDVIPCADGKARRIEPTIQPLAHGVSGRVGLLRGAGNAIVPQVAATFVRAFMEADKASETGGGK